MIQATADSWSILILIKIIIKIMRWRLYQHLQKHVFPGAPLSLSQLSNWFGFSSGQSQGPKTEPCIGILA